MTGELDPCRLNLHTKMRSGGNGMGGRGPAQHKQSLKKKIFLIYCMGSKNCFKKKKHENGTFNLCTLNSFRCTVCNLNAFFSTVPKTSVADL